MTAVEVAKRLERDHRPATAGEQHAMARWSSWGAIPQVFDESNSEWQAEREQLRGLLTADEWAAARRTTINAHYTDPAYVREIWTAVCDLGLTEGEVLEPGAGSGTFIGMAPEGVKMTGIELDPVSASIARGLYPQAAIRTESFAETRLPRGVADAVVGNVPFGDITLHDPEFNPGRHTIHNHFIVKSLAMTRPGGMVAVLTSRYTMDATSPAARREMNSMGDLVGAVRLPTGAHRRAAGTDALTDLLILRRRLPGEPKRDTSWEMATLVEVDGQSINVNSYFQAHPENVLGQLHLGHGMYGQNTVQVRPVQDQPTPELLAGRLADIVGHAHDQGLTVTEHQTVRQAQPSNVLAPEGQQWDGTILTGQTPGQFRVVQNGLQEELEVPSTQSRQLRALIGLRDKARGLLDAEAAEPDDTPALQHQRQELRATYDAYTAEHGPLNRYELRRTGRFETELDETTGEPIRDEMGQPVRGAEIMARHRPPVMRTFKTDPHYALVMALENFDDASQSSTPSTLLSTRAVAPRPHRQGADTPAEAIALCLNETGGLDLERLADLLRTGKHEARQALGTMAYDDPVTGDLVHAPDYLSGDIYTKLEQARAAAQEDPQYRINATALEEALPAPLGPAEIHARLGAVWIPAQVHQQFLTELLQDRSVQVENPLPGQWRVSGANHGLSATEEWGTTRKSAGQITEALMKQAPIVVNDRIDGDDGKQRYVINPVETEAAQVKAEQLQDRFREWIWDEPERASTLAAEYNRRFNSIRLRDYDQAGGYLTLPGLAETISLRPHQRSAVARMISEPATGLFHQVGAGKTLEMVVGAHEMRRMGLVRKPAAVVPNHMLEQFTREWLQAYPQARILAASSSDLAGERRRLFVARAAANDWDGIVLTHGAFKRIGTSPQTAAEYIDRELERLRTSLEHARQEGSDISVKRIEKLILRKEEEHKKKLDTPRDPGITFEETGIDYLLVDEAHEFKNLMTESSIPDANIAGSDAASDLHMKLEYLRSRHGKRVATLATATPLANSITEAYVTQRYLRPDLLERAGITSFDGWAATFGQTVTNIEMGPAGGFRQKTRFARFQNVPELLRLWHTFADVKTAEDLNLPTPAIAARASDGQRTVETVLIPPTTELQAYIEDIGERAEAVASHQVDRETDNMLKISTDGRAAALDLRLVAPEEQEPTGPVKLDTVAETIAAHWQDNAQNQYLDAEGQPSPLPGSLQLVFCDLGTPSDEHWDAYHELKAKLIERGIPTDQIRFMHEAKNDSEKARLFAAARSGHVAVLMGSTKKMGMGTNVQNRVTALHHIDCPWRPADVEQRDGRAIRQGNQNDEVALYRYVIEGSFDAYSWQTVARKAEFIAQLMRGRLDVREIEDIGDTALSASEAKAIASGNPLLLEKAEADATVEKLSRQERAHHRAQATLEYNRRTASDSIDPLQRQAEALEAAQARSIDTSGEHFSMTIAGTPYTKRSDTADAFTQALIRNGPDPGGPATPVGTIGGHTVIAERISSSFYNGYELSLQDVPRSSSTHSAETALSPNIGIIRQLENKVANIGRSQAAVANEIAAAHKTIAQADERLGAAFSRTDELRDARERATQINEQLAGSAHDTAEPAPTDPPKQAANTHEVLRDLRARATELDRRAQGQDDLEPPRTLSEAHRPPSL